MRCVEPVDLRLIVQGRALIGSYRTETAKKSRDIADLRNPDAPRVFQVTRCSACGGQLELVRPAPYADRAHWQPTMHFMCKHSFHARCLGDNDAECPNCARSHGLVREVLRSNAQFADRHDLFVQECAHRSSARADRAGSRRATTDGRRSARRSAAGSWASRGPTQPSRRVQCTFVQCSSVYRTRRVQHAAEREKLRPRSRCAAAAAGRAPARRRRPAAL